MPHRMRNTIRQVPLRRTLFHKVLDGDITTPFGGYKTSGFGGYDKGIEAFDQYTQLKTIWVTLA
jgi:acyl-CoA reductase-like NAD-dependent aldehyde dehydrogenase